MKWWVLKSVSLVLAIIASYRFVQIEPEKAIFYMGCAVALLFLLATHLVPEDNTDSPPPGKFH